MRDVPASIAAGFLTDRQPLARCLVLLLRDGTLLGFTDHDEDIDVDISETFYNLVCRADLGMRMDNIDLAVGLDASTTEVRIPLRDTVSRIAALGRRYNQAIAWIFDVDWSADIKEPMALLKGWVAETKVPQNAAVLEIRSFADFFNIVQGRILSPRCSADFGDEQCAVVVVDIAASVTTRISDMRFEVDLAGSYADGYFRFGEGEFTGGDLDGIAPFEVFNYTGASGLVEALAPLPTIPQVGDTLILRQGCSKLKISDDATLPTCQFHDNCRRFRGFDRVPGSDIYVRLPIPGQG